MAARKPKPEPERIVSIMQASGTRPPSTLDDISGAISPKKLEEIREKYHVDILVQEGMRRKEEFSRSVKGQIFNGAFDASMNYFEHGQARRNSYAQSNPEAYVVADQLLQGTMNGVSNSHYNSANAMAGRLDDITMRSIDPDPEPERQPGFWERMRGGG